MADQYTQMFNNRSTLPTMETPLLDQIDLAVPKEEEQKSGELGGVPPQEVADPIGDVVDFPQEMLEADMSDMPQIGVDIPPIGDMALAVTQKAGDILIGTLALGDKIWDTVVNDSWDYISTRIDKGREMFDALDSGPDVGDIASNLNNLDEKMYEAMRKQDLLPEFAQTPISAVLTTLGRLTDSSTEMVKGVLGKDMLQGIMYIAYGEFDEGIELMKDSFVNTLRMMEVMGGLNGQEAIDRVKAEDPGAGSLFGYLTTPENVAELVEYIPDWVIEPVNRYVSTSLKDNFDLSTGLLSMVELSGELAINFSPVAIAKKLNDFNKAQVLTGQITNTMVRIKQFGDKTGELAKRVVEYSAELTKLYPNKAVDLFSNLDGLRNLLGDVAETGRRHINRAIQTEKGFAQLDNNLNNKASVFAKFFQSGLEGSLKTDWNRMLGDFFNAGKDKFTKKFLASDRNLKDFLVNFNKIGNLMGKEHQLFFRMVDGQLKKGYAEAKVNAINTVSQIFKDSMKEYTGKSSAGKFAHGFGFASEGSTKAKIGSNVKMVIDYVRMKDSLRRMVNAMSKDKVDAVKQVLGDEMEKLTPNQIHAKIKESVDSGGVWLKNQKYLADLGSGKKLTALDIWTKIQEVEKYLKDNNLMGDVQRMADSLHEHGMKYVNAGFLTEETLNRGYGAYFPNSVDIEKFTQITDKNFQSMLTSAFDPKSPNPLGLVDPTAVKQSKAWGNFADDPIESLYYYFSTTERLEKKAEAFDQIVSRYAINTADVQKILDGTIKDNPNSYAKYYDKDGNLHKEMAFVYFQERNKKRALMTKTPKKEDPNNLLAPGAKKTRKSRTKVEKDVGRMLEEDEFIFWETTLEHISGMSKQQEVIDFMNDIVNDKSFTDYMKKRAEDVKPKIDGMTLNTHAKALYNFIQGSRSEIEAVIQEGLGDLQGAGALKKQASSFYKGVLDVLDVTTQKGRGNTIFKQVAEQAKQGRLADSITALGEHRIALVPKTVLDNLQEVTNSRPFAEFTLDGVKINNNMLTKYGNRVKKSMTSSAFLDFFGYNFRNALESFNVFAMHPEAFAFFPESMAYAKKELGNKVTGGAVLESISIPMRFHNTVEKVWRKFSDPDKLGDIKKKADPEAVSGFMEEFDRKSGSSGYISETTTQAQIPMTGSLESATRSSAKAVMDLFADIMGVGSNRTPILGDARATMEKIAMTRENIMRRSLYVARRVAGDTPEKALDVVDKVLVNFNTFAKPMDFASSTMFNFMKTRVGFTTGWGRQIGELWDKGKKGEYGFVADRVARTIGMTFALKMIGDMLDRDFETPLNVAQEVTMVKHLTDPNNQTGGKVLIEWMFDNVSNMISPQLRAFDAFRNIGAFKQSIINPEQGWTESFLELSKFLLMSSSRDISSAFRLFDPDTKQDFWEKAIDKLMPGSKRYDSGKSDNPFENMWNGGSTKKGKDNPFENMW